MVCVWCCVMFFWCVCGVEKMVNVCWDDGDVFDVFDVVVWCVMWCVCVWWDGVGCVCVRVCEWLCLRWWWLMMMMDLMCVNVNRCWNLRRCFVRGVRSILCIRWCSIRWVRWVCMCKVCGVWKFYGWWLMCVIVCVFELWCGCDVCDDVCVKCIFFVDMCDWWFDVWFVYWI